MSSEYLWGTTTPELIKKTMVKCGFCKAWVTKHGIKSHFRKMHPEEAIILEEINYDWIRRGDKKLKWNVQPMDEKTIKGKKE